MRRVLIEHFVSIDCISHHANHLIYCLIEVEKVHLWRRFPDVITDAGDNIFGSISVPDDTGKRFHDLGQIWRALFQEAHSRTSVVARSGNRMQDLVGQRGGQLSHDAQAMHMREIGFQLSQSLGLLLRALAFRHVDVRSDNLDILSMLGEQQDGRWS